MNKYNPYTVPESFFEDFSKAAVSKYRRRTRAVRCGIAAMAVAATLLIPAFIQSSQSSVDNTEMQAQANNLAEMYDYDIFLQVSF